MLEAGASAGNSAAPDATALAAADLNAFARIACSLITGDLGSSDSKREAALPESVRRVLDRARSPNARLPADRFADQIVRALTDVGLPDTESAASTKTRSVQMASILFIDVVGYSLLSTERQSGVLKTLQAVVRETTQFAKAQTRDELISIPTGDGMALVFFTTPVVPVNCALEITRAFKKQSDVKLRMGVHTGPVYRVADINANTNVAGGGINMAQRVMDCGNPGQILLSSAVAEFLLNLNDWPQYLNDLGEHSVKHGVKVRLYTLCTADAGCHDIPERLTNRSAALVSAAQQTSRPRTHRALYIALGSVLSTAIMILIAVQGPELLHLNSHATDRDNAASSTPSRQSAPVSPGSPAAVPSSSPRNAASEPPTKPVPPLVRPRAASSDAIADSPATREAAPPVPQATASATREIEPAPASVAPSLPETKPAASQANEPATRQLKERMVFLKSRAGVLKRLLLNLRQDQARQGLRLRSDVVAQEQQIDAFLNDSESALKAGDIASAAQALDFAERQIDSLEKALGR
ncbi:MAG TPA: adenylate/guanylate cyclase domain-containing protein [Bryobacteraceae bacterium]|nr:adenylate/guanylate cyclase domain-containing protein [Bryobacteraceae bacterium]